MKIKFIAEGAMTFSFDIASDLSAPRAQVLDHAATIAGANRELGPFLWMTTPRAFRGLTRFTPRIPGTGPLLVRIVRALFRHRHARLRAMFGTSIA
jgi:hypothetical protein